MARVWTISANDVKGGNLGLLLVGCHVTENKNSTGYEFTAPDLKVVLGTTAGRTLPRGTFAFSGFSYEGPQWTIAVSLLETSQIQGIWGARALGIRETDDESGNWTAQAGSGEGRGKPEPPHRGAAKPRARGAGRG
jgi:hypothetical protein